VREFKTTVRGLLVSQIPSTDEMQDGQFARPVTAFEHRKIVAALQNPAQHVRRLRRVQAPLEHGM